MSGDKSERVERVLDFSPEKKAGARDKAGRGRPGPVLEDRSSSFWSVTSCQFNRMIDRGPGRVAGCGHRGPLSDSVGVRLKGMFMGGLKVKQAEGGQGGCTVNVLRAQSGFDWA